MAPQTNTHTPQQTALRPMTTAEWKELKRGYQLLGFTFFIYYYVLMTTCMLKVYFLLVCAYNVIRLVIMIVI